MHSRREFVSAVAFVGALGMTDVRSAAAGITQVRKPPLVIAHRGASGHLPEHTLAAYALAVGLGSDVIEPDVVMTKDHVLICSHDLTAEETTNARAIFPELARPDGKIHYADLTLAQVKTLHKQGRVGKNAGQQTPPPFAATGHQIPTLQEMVEQVQSLNASLGRQIKIIPEPKAPAKHLEWGLDICKALCDSLVSMGYKGADADAMVQCFEIDALERMRGELGCDLPLVYLFGEDIKESVFERAIEVCTALGPNRKLVMDQVGQPLPLVEKAAAHSLSLYPWTFKAEVDVMRQCMSIQGVAGLFTDFPEAGRQAADLVASGR